MYTSHTVLFHTIIQYLCIYIAEERERDCRIDHPAGSNVGKTSPNSLLGAPVINGTAVIALDLTEDRW